MVVSISIYLSIYLLQPFKYVRGHGGVEPRKPRDEEASHPLIDRWIDR